MVFQNETWQVLIIKLRYFNFKPSLKFSGVSTSNCMVLSAINDKFNEW